MMEEDLDVPEESSPARLAVSTAVLGATKNASETVDEATLTKPTDPIYFVKCRDRQSRGSSYDRTLVNEIVMIKHKIETSLRKVRRIPLSKLETNEMLRELWACVGYLEHGLCRVRLR